MSRILKLSSVLVLVLGALVVGLLAWVRQFDVEDYRAAIEGTVSEATGRELAIRGEMRLALGWRPRLVLEDARIANAGWATTPEMARVGRLVLEVDLLPWLLAREVRIHRLVVSDADLALERDADGRRNWQNEPTGEASQREASTFDAIAELAGEILVERSRVRWSDGISGRELPITIDRLAIHASPPGSKATIVGRGQWHDQPFDVRGTIGPIDALGASEGEVTGALRGTIAPFGDFFAEGTWTKKSAARPRIEARVRSERFAVPWAAEDRSVADNVFSTAPLPLATLRAVDGRIEVEARHLSVRAADAEDVHFVIGLDGGHLRVDPFRVRFGAGKMSGVLSLDAAQTPPLASLSLSADDLDLEKLVAAAGLPGTVRGGRTRFAIDLHGRGGSPAAIAATLEGEAKLLAGKGSVRTDALDSLVIGPDRMLGELVAVDKRFAKVGCAAIDLAFRNGVGRPEVLLVDTTKSTLVGEGEINLAAQTIHLEIVPSPKLVTLSVGVPLEISGALRRPRVKADELGAVRRLGGMLTIAVFPPAALASLAELGERENPCLALAEGKRPREDSGIVAAARKTGEGVVGTIGGGAKAIGSAVRGLFGE